jgi:hypothetical protein
MGPIGIVMSYPVPNKGLCVSSIFKIMKVDTLVLQGSPEPFNEDIVHPASLAIHGDFDPVVSEGIGKREAGELAPLVRVENLWFAVLCDGFL